jgi:hypothetical protein
MLSDSAIVTARRAGKLPSILALMLALIFAFVMVGCWGNSDTDLGDDTDTEGEPLPAPAANVQINYGHKGDALARATVTKFFSVQVIDTKPHDAHRTESLARFDGGVPVWEFKADHGLINEVSTLARSNKYAVRNLDYGKLPPHFEQIIPDEGPPEPLDRGSFYVFEIERESGSTSYQVVKVLADGSLQVYAAAPRAGTSYLLCCDIVSDFSEPVLMPDQTLENPDAGQSQSSPENPDAEQPPPPPPPPSLDDQH